MTTAPHRPAGLRADTATATRLASQLRGIAGREVAEARITPATYGGGQVWCVLLLDPRRREIPAPGRTRQIVDYVRSAFPDAQWNRAQDYDVTAGVLVEHTVARPPSTAHRLPHRSLRGAPSPDLGHRAVAARARRADGVWVYAMHSETREAARKAASRVRLNDVPDACYEPTGSFDADFTSDADGASVWVRYTGGDQ
ncbi:hypothetical protein ACIQU5_28080 [Streptomyces sp. NPDC090306]|uniref:hypothetical protein n=1 Tax=Streptomyces sp. NPDC090306 TaxID=3365961 RepID=UPI003801E52A